ncbi:serine/threonine-protein kinase [Sphaerimonospora cavernae]|uniref:non-specific serine/threonine protein kinase n=1 Tax=Sphaerimonospora cavernae TaxID=1740611 RepID=A0ABV6UA34_9ACTN
MTSAGSTLGGRYRLTSPIAAGGMGEVWRAVDELLGREVAVKLLRSHVAADPSFRDRFRAEARITAGLADPGIAQVFDYGESDGAAYLIMELVIGEPLAAILARHGALDPQVALDVVQQTARGLYAAHRAGVIHRDIKPGNLLVTEDGQVKITDFGIARALEAAPLTRTGIVLGTARYVSPEQASGSALTSASDIYSLGVVAYECLAGRPPFAAETQVALAIKHINEQPPPLPAAVPPPVRALVSDMLAKQPAARPASGPDLVNRVAALREALTGLGEAVTGTALHTLTDPGGFPVWGSRTPPATRNRPAVPSTPAASRIAPATTDAMTRAGRPRTAPYSRPHGAAGRTVGHGVRRRRRVAVIGAAAGCAAAVAVGGVLMFPAGRPETPTFATTSPPPVSPPLSPSPRPTTAITWPTTPKASNPVPPAASAKPSAVPSATVSTSAPPTQQPSSAPSPSPTPTPTPTPASTPSEVPTPSVSPTDTGPPDEVGT